MRSRFRTRALLPLLRYSERLTLSTLRQGRGFHDISNVELYIRDIMWRTDLCGVDPVSRRGHNLRALFYCT